MTQIGRTVKTVRIPKPMKAPLVATPIVVPTPVKEPEKVEVRVR